jgi:hypothetical protein
LLPRTPRCDRQRRGGSNDQAGQPQHPRCSCTGGHFTEPKEQNTQQSPGLGRRSVLQWLHS